MNQMMPTTTKGFGSFKLKNGETFRQTLQSLQNRSKRGDSIEVYSPKSGMYSNATWGLKEHNLMKSSNRKESDISHQSIQEKSILRRYHNEIR